MNKKISISVALAVSIIAMTVTVAITWIVAMNKFDNAVKAVVKRQAQYEKIAEIDTYARGKFLGEIDDAILFDKMAQGYVAGLGDRNSVYYTEKEFTEMQQMETGEVVPIGIEVVKDATNYFRIAKVYTDSPAEKAGLEKGGLITAINGIDTKTFTGTKQMRSALRGPVGETAELVVLYNATEEKKFEIQRDNYRAPTVEAPIMVDGVAYIQITSFDSQTSTEFDFALREAINSGAKALVFDLRDNQGGTFKSAYQIIDQITPRGTIAKSESKNGTLKVLATSGEETIDLPMVVIVNENTAAAAELFAVSVRDLSGGKIVGSTTNGKGTLQSAPQRLSDGSAISITEAKLLTGRDESFDVIGIEPDVEVLLDSPEEVNLFAVNVQTDRQIVRALDVVRNMAGLNPGQQAAQQSAPSEQVESGTEEVASSSAEEPQSDVSAESNPA